MPDGDKSSRSCTRVYSNRIFIFAIAITITRSYLNKNYAYLVVVDDLAFMYSNAQPLLEIRSRSIYARVVFQFSRRD